MTRNIEKKCGPTNRQMRFGARLKLGSSSAMKAVQPGQDNVKSNFTCNGAGADGWLGVGWMVDGGCSMGVWWMVGGWWVGVRWMVDSGWVLGGCWVWMISDF